MSEKPYEYGGLKARAWDLLRGDTSGWPDRAFYRDAIRRYGEPALDVGCGTGRLLLDYMQQGIDIDGVDNSPEMLAICRDRAETLGLSPALFEQRMEALDLPCRYRTIIVPSSSFQLLTGRNDAREAMQRLFGSLENGGALIMPFMAAWSAGPLPPDGTWTAWQPAGSAVRPEDGATVRRFQRIRFDHDQQFEHEEDRYEVVRDGVIIEEETHLMSPATRWYSHEQSLSLFRDAGFSAIRSVSGFTDAPATPEDRIWTVFGVRPAP